MLNLLKELISIPSFSKEEAEAVDVLEKWMKAKGLKPNRVGNNLWCCLDEVDESGVLVPSMRPTILLNAHIDTVRPASGYTRNPFSPEIEGDRLYGLGSNDDGGSLVALLAVYMRLMEKPQPYRLIFSATAEEEICGTGGLDMLLPFLGKIDLGIMGEPTGMRLAVAERGLMVLDCTAYGKSGHAARNEGENAIYKAIKAIDWFSTYNFDKVSSFLGPVKMTVTQINAGTQHNVVPDKCTFVVDVRPNGLYTNTEILEIIKSKAGCEVKERSTRLGSSSISMDHSVVQKGLSLGLETFGSPTTSNQAVSPFTTVKIGPGESARSHSADEYICISEIEKGVEIYYRLLDNLRLD